jgi:hypothetical protein
LGDRPALSPAETFYQRVLAGHSDEAIEQAEDYLEANTLTSYYDDVVLAGLRLAVADVDRGAVERDALRSVCETVMAVLAELLERRDGIGDTTLSSDEAGTSARTPKSVICFPGRGPLDVAVAAMMAHLLRRTGCTVRQEERDPLRRNSPAFADVQDVDAICILGLFDERALGRMVPFMQQIDASRVLIGVRRGNASPGGENALAVLPSLAAVRDGVHGSPICGAMPEAG